MCNPNTTSSSNPVAPIDPKQQNPQTRHHFYFDLLSLPKIPKSSNNIIKHSNNKNTKFFTLPEFISESKSLFSLSFPIVLTALILYSRSILSMLFLGHLGDIELAAGSLAIAFANITGYSVLSGLALGMEPLCSQAFGAQRPKLLSLTLHRSVIFLLLFSLPISFLWLNVSRILLYLHQDPDIIRLSHTYLLFSLPELVMQVIGTRRTRTYTYKGIHDYVIYLLLYTTRSRFFPASVGIRSCDILDASAGIRRQGLFLLSCTTMVCGAENLVRWFEVESEIDNMVDWNSPPIYDEYDDGGILTDIKNSTGLVDFFIIDKFLFDSNVEKNFINLSHFWLMSGADFRRCYGIKRIKTVKYSKYLICWAGRQQYYNNNGQNSRSNFLQQRENDAGSTVRLIEPNPSVLGVSLGLGPVQFHIPFKLPVRAFSLHQLVTNSFIHPIRIYLRAQGITHPLTLASLAGTIFHLPINFILVSRLNYGVAGVAAASAASNLFVLVTLVGYVWVSGLHVPTWTAPSMDCLTGWKPLLKLAAPSCVSVCLEWWWYEIMIILCGLLVDPKSTVASMGVLIQTTALIYVFPSSLGFAVSTRVGNELGANRPEKARSSAIVSIVLAAVMGLTAMMFASGMRDVWGRMFTSDETIVRLTSAALPILGLCELGNCPQTVGCGVLRGSARPSTAANVNLSAFYLVGMPVAIGLGFWMGVGFCGLWAGLFAAQICCAGLMLYVVGTTDWEVQAKRAQMLTSSTGSNGSDIGLPPSSDSENEKEPLLCIVVTSS